MSTPSAIGLFALVAGLLTIIPGLDTALVLRAVFTRSRRHALRDLGGRNGSWVDCHGRWQPGAILVSRHDHQLTESEGWFTLLITGAHFTTRWLRTTLARRVIDRITASVLIGFGIKQALKSRLVWLVETGPVGRSQAGLGLLGATVRPDLRSDSLR